MHKLFFLHPIEQEITNKMGTLHGGFVPLLVDNISSLALTLPGDLSAAFGVLVNMNLSYLKVEYFRVKHFHKKAPKIG